MQTDQLRYMDERVKLTITEVKRGEIHEYVFTCKGSEKRWTMKDYRVQDACVNCTHVYVQIDWDTDASYQCRFGRMVRPVLSKPYTNEDLNTFWGRDREYTMDTGPSVEAHGICDNYTGITFAAAAAAKLYT